MGLAIVTANVNVISSQGKGSHCQGWKADISLDEWMEAPLHRRLPHLHTLYFFGLRAMFIFLRSRCSLL